ncbi:MAG TPA: hypothetical protein VIE86_02820 [Nitrososphaera sp.]|jgi:hypothetical protein
MRLGKRQGMGILGMVLAVAGGAAWYFGQHILAVFSWAAAFVILLRLNKKKR